MSNEMKMTAAQAAGLAKLKAGGFAVTALGNLDTGVNSKVLRALRTAGLITVTTIYNGGTVSPDLKVG